jgi:hypothetical protein
MARVIKKCRNHKCRQLFSAFSFVTDKKGVLKAICPHCKSQNSLGGNQKKKLIVNRISN